LSAIGISGLSKADMGEMETRKIKIFSPAEYRNILLLFHIFNNSIITTVDVDSGLIAIGSVS
jgi:hypothetical protein